MNQQKLASNPTQVVAPVNAWSAAMADGDQGMPLTFQNFLEKMRHPSASELVKSIKVRRSARTILT